MKKLLYSILIILIITLVVLLYSRFLGTKGLKVHEISLSCNIPVSYEGLKIIHFSDLHYRKVIREEQVENAIETINRTKPDIVLFTGDLLDEDYDIKNTDINFLIEQLSKIETKYGSYAIFGDHDNKFEEEIRNIYIQSNFTLLENNYTVVHNENNDKILIGGVGSSLNRKIDIDKILKEITEEDKEIATQIMLTHEPDTIPELLSKFPNTSIILAGHSINGSINIPIIKKFLLPNGAKNYYEPYYQIDETTIYISNGIGVNQVNFRLLNTPSINFYRIKKSN